MDNHQQICLAKERILNNFETNLNYILDKCESEIEQLFFLSFIEGFNNENFNISFVWPKAEESDEFIIPIALIFKGMGRTISIMPQAKVVLENANYRLDFLIQNISGGKVQKKFVIECDGYEFHNKDIKQVNRDNIRSRNLNRAGYLVYRFSGSEIHQRAREGELVDMIIEQITAPLITL